MKLGKITIIFLALFLILGMVTVPRLSLAYEPYGEEGEDLSSTTKVLVTGFESWLSIYDPNPAQLIAENLSGQIINEASIVSIVVPVVWDEAVDVVVQAIKDYNPDVVISIGTGVISSIRVEKIGLNLKSCIMPDNEGNRFLLRRIDPRGPFIRFSSLPTKMIVSEINKAGIPAERSYNAGRFICNEVLYGVLSYIDKNDLPIKAGFIHVPLLNSQDPERGMELDIMIEAVKIAIMISL